MNPYIEILRPVNAVMAVITVILMALITGRFDSAVLLASAVVFMATVQECDNPPWTMR